MINMRWEYVKPYICVKISDYYEIGIVTWNQVIMHELFVLERNT